MLRPDRAAPRLQSLDQRLAHLATTGLDLVVVEPFTVDLGRLSPVAFAKRFLVEALGVRGLALGHDFRFGRGRTGDIETLRSHLDVPIRRIEAALHEGAPISSSRIRAALGAGDVATAAALLGRPHEVEGTVVPGDQRGRGLGFPTANLAGLSGLLPSEGVYAVRVDGHPRWRTWADAPPSVVASRRWRSTYWILTKIYTTEV